MRVCIRRAFLPLGPLIHLAAGSGTPCWRPGVSTACSGAPPGPRRPTPQPSAPSSSSASTCSRWAPCSGWRGPPCPAAGRPPAAAAAGQRHWCAHGLQRRWTPARTSGRRRTTGVRRWGGSQAAPLRRRRPHPRRRLCAGGSAGAVAAAPALTRAPPSALPRSRRAWQRGVQRQVRAVQERGVGRGLPGGLQPGRGALPRPGRRPAGCAGGCWAICGRRAADGRWAAGC